MKSTQTQNAYVLSSINYHRNAVLLSYEAMTYFGSQKQSKIISILRNIK
jgi:hypothetical protein